MTTIEQKPLLQVIGLSTHFLSFGGKRVVKAVDNVSFQIDEGARVALIGESGCGKTTVGRCLLRLIEPSSGEVWHNSTNLLSLTRDDMRKERRNMQIGVII